MDRNKAKELLPVIQAYAEGREVQYYSRVNRMWMWPDSPSFDTSVEWRIAPDKKWFRIGLFNEGPAICFTDSSEERYPKSITFIRWLTDRIYYEK